MKNDLEHCVFFFFLFFNYARAVLCVSTWKKSNAAQQYSELKQYSLHASRIGLIFSCRACYCMRSILLVDILQMMSLVHNMFIVLHFILLLM